MRSRTVSAFLGGLPLPTCSSHPVSSTNLIVELGLMILLLLGWEFLLAELLGGVILIVVMVAIVHLTLPENLFDEVRIAINRRDRESGVTEDPTCGMEGTDEYIIMTDGGETATEQTYFELNYTLYLNLIAFLSQPHCVWTLRVPPVCLPARTRSTRPVPRSGVRDADRRKRPERLHRRGDVLPLLECVQTAVRRPSR